MLQIKFVVPGNQEDENGGPMPYSDGYRKFVRQCFYQQFKVNGEMVMIDDVLAKGLIEKTGFAVRPSNGLFPPIRVEKYKVHIGVSIYWKDKPYYPADLFESILQAILSNECHLKSLKSAQFQSQMSEDKSGRVEVSIGIE